MSPGRKVLEDETNEYKLGLALQTVQHVSWSKWRLWRSADVTVDGLLPMRRGQPPSQRVAERTEQRLGWLSVQERRRRERSPAAAAGSGLEETSLSAAWAQGTQPLPVKMRPAEN